MARPPKITGLPTTPPRGVRAVINPAAREHWEATDALTAIAVPEPAIDHVIRSTERAMVVTGMSRREARKQIARVKDASKGADDAE